MLPMARALKQSKLDADELHAPSRANKNRRKMQRQREFAKEAEYTSCRKKVTHIYSFFIISKQPLGNLT